MLAGPATAALDEWDDYCLPDDVLNAMLDAAAPAMPAAPAAATAPSPHPAPSSNMFSSFFPPGPLAAAAGAAASHAPAPQLSSAVGGRMPHAAAAPPHQLAHQPPPQRQLRQQLPPPPLPQPQPQPQPPVDPSRAPPHQLPAPLPPGGAAGGGAESQLHRYVGEVEVLRARLGEAEQTSARARQREEALKAEYDAELRRRESAEAEALRQLQSTLAFREQELERTARDLERARAALRASGSLAPPLPAGGAAAERSAAGRAAEPAAVEGGRQGGREGGRPPLATRQPPQPRAHAACSSAAGGAGMQDSPPLLCGASSSSKGPPRTPALSGARRPHRLSGSGGGGSERAAQAQTPSHPPAWAGAPRTADGAAAAESLGRRKSSPSPPRLVAPDRTLLPDDTDEQPSPPPESRLAPADANLDRAPPAAADPLAESSSPMQLDGPVDAPEGARESEAPSQGGGGGMIAAGDALVAAGGGTGGAAGPAAVRRHPALLLPLLMRPGGPLQRLVLLSTTVGHGGGGVSASQLLAATNQLLDATSQLASGDCHAPALLAALEPYLCCFSPGWRDEARAGAAGGGESGWLAALPRPAPVHGTATHTLGGIAGGDAGGGGARALLVAALATVCALFGASAECRAVALPARETGGGGGDGGASPGEAAGDVEMGEASRTGPRTVDALLALANSEMGRIATAPSRRGVFDDSSVILPAVRALSLLLWAEPPLAAAPCPPAFRRWLGDDGDDGDEVAGCTFSALLSERSPHPVRLATIALLGSVLRSEEAFGILVKPAAPPRRSSAAGRLAALLSTQHKRTHTQSGRAASGVVGAALGGDGWGSALPRCGADSVGLAARGAAVASAFPEELDAEGWEDGEGSAVGGEGCRHGWPQRGRPEARESCAALRLFSRLAVAHPAAPRRLLDPLLDLALPVRLVSLLQAQVHWLFSGGRADPLELALVEDSLLLLLELARCTEMCVELAGGSWIADLSVVTEHLVRNEVHPALARLGLPAKMLQNALKPAALRG